MPPANQNSKGVYHPAVGKPVVRSSGIVIPHRLKWTHRLLAWVVYCLIRVVGATLRYRWVKPGFLDQAESPVIFCIWHNRLALCLLIYRLYARWRKKDTRMAAIVSASKDGAVVARILEHFKVQPVRGSTSRRGPQALLELTTWAEQGYDLAITPDGPRGPRYRVQPGVIALGQLTGRPVVPACYNLSWKICTQSWDGFQIPLPFSRAVIKTGEPLYVPREASAEEREALRQELEKRLLALTSD